MPPALSQDLSWTRAQSGAIDIPERDLSANLNDQSRPVWFRHQTALESGSRNGSKIITSLRISPPSPSCHELNFEVLKAAVRQLRFDHPAIASEFGWSAQPPTPEHAVFAYEVPGSESDIDTWLSKVVFDRTSVLLASNGDMDKAVETITYDLGKPDLNGGPVFVLHYIPAASPDGQHSLVFFLNHSVFDAIGAFQIMDLCLSKIADLLATGAQRRPLPWGEETLRLPPALVESARIPCTAVKTPEDEAIIQNVKDSLHSLQVRG
ncbi:hypothetical protein PHLCEN_2v9457 [Hermanssonia centrifuga]|uniref:Uncharacterized protein n=1 Tax=Hermanssonia centrifuga TaxID=98765 RepID=A0A2R6NQQ9_9APHY|nr:hypothetical protein PHLCEN_2v9457 [Hermanssonia centrifuga]